MGQDTYCDVGVFVQFDFDWSRLRQMIAGGIDQFYIYLRDYDDEAFNFSEEEELRDWISPRKNPSMDGVIIHCFIPCVKSGVHNLSSRPHPLIFTYNGEDTVDSLIKNLQDARDKFRSLGFSDESIMIGNNFMDCC